MSTVQGDLSEETEQYLGEKKVPQLMEHMYRELLLTMPLDPLEFLSKLLENEIVPKIIIAGPPAGGKGTQCEMIAEKYGVVHVSTGDLLREEVKQGSALGKQAQVFMTQGSLVPDALMVEIVKDRLSQGDVIQKGWLLDGFPRTRPQALALQINGIIPSAFLVLDVPDEVVKERIEGRRTDPATGKVYHMVYNPPPGGLEVEQRADDTADAIESRLRIFHRNMDDVLQCYPSVAVHIDGNRSKEAIFAEAAEQLDTRLMMV